MENYLSIYLSIYICEKKTNKVQVHPHKPVSWSPTHQDPQEYTLDKLRKIFNRNTIKISYSCMNNTKQIIDNHNKRI